VVYFETACVAVIVFYYQLYPNPSVSTPLASRRSTSPCAIRLSTLNVPQRCRDKKISIIWASSKATKLSLLFGTLKVQSFIVIHCSAFQCVAERCRVLQCVVVYCSALQCVAVQCSALQCVAVRCSALQCVAVQCIEVCCSALQRVAIFSSVLYCVAVRALFHSILEYFYTMRPTTLSTDQTLL